MSDPFVLQREANREPFVAQVGDTTLTFTHPADLDAIKLSELFSREDISAVEFMVGTLFLGMDQENQDTLRGLSLDTTEIRALYVAWQAHGGLAEGESSPSAAS